MHNNEPPPGMPKHIWKTLEEVGNELAGAAEDLNLYLQLFSSTPEAVGILNRAAPKAFLTIRDALSNSIIMGLARVTDKRRDASNIHTLYTLSKNHITNEEILNNLKLKTQEIVDLSKLLKTLRDTRLAHYERDAESKLEEVWQMKTIPIVKKVIRETDYCLNLLNRHYWQGTIDYSNPLPAPQGDSILFFLQKGMDANTAEHEI